MVWVQILGSPGNLIRRTRTARTLDYAIAHIHILYRNHRLRSEYIHELKNIKLKLDHCSNFCTYFRLGNITHFPCRIIRPKCCNDARQWNLNWPDTSCLSPFAIIIIIFAAQENGRVIDTQFSLHDCVSATDGQCRVGKSKIIHPFRQATPSQKVSAISPIWVSCNIRLHPARNFFLFIKVFMLHALRCNAATIPCWRAQDSRMTSTFPMPLEGTNSRHFLSLTMHGRVKKDRP